MTSHPLILGAAASVIVASLVASAALTGLLPGAQSHRGELPAPKAAAACADCGTVTSIRQVQVNGQASGAGAVAGGVTGAVVGSQFGRGDGRTALTILGAAGGAYAGHNIEKNLNKSSAWRITVRMDDDTHRTVSQAEPPAFAVGDKVRVSGGRAYADNNRRQE